jgi:ectoine hydroxylase-related dioxygenase (phytanoyl-CoA dioxygenase family)
MLVTGILATGSKTMAGSPNTLVLNRSAIDAAEKRGPASQSERDGFRQELLGAVAELDLWRNVAELDINGYTVVRNAAAPAFFDELRETIRGLSAERRRQGLYGDKRGVFSDTILNCVGKGAVFEQAVLNRKLNTLMAYLLGDGYVINATNAIIVEQGAPALPIHSDNAYVPEPFPHWALTATSVWFTENVDAERGASRVVPASHRYQRAPKGGEGEAEAVALDCPANSIAIWNGALWHGNCGRNAPGERVTFHTSMCRMHIKPFANNADVPQSVVERNPPLMAQLLGRGLPMGVEGEDGPNPELRATAARLATRRL